MEMPRERSWFGRNWKWLLPVGCLLPFVAVGGCVTLVVVGVLGEPIEPAFLVSGNIHVSNRGGNADVHYGITGPKASGTVHAVAFKEGGGWQFRSIIVETSTGEKIDVLDRQESAELTQEAI